MKKKCVTKPNLSGLDQEDVKSLDTAVNAIEEALNLIDPEARQAVYNYLYTAVTAEFQRGRMLDFVRQGVVLARGVKL